MINTSGSLPIGIFDSGIGGLSVTNAVLRLLPQESIIYFGDSVRAPYGKRRRSEIVEFCFQITQYLLDRGCKAIVVACNTASAAALDQLRAHWPQVPFIGIEPAIKPAAKMSQSGVLGVMATEATFLTERYLKLEKKYAPNLQVIQDPCQDLVKEIEKVEWESEELKKVLQAILLPLLEQKADTFVLGCTHYPLILPQIKDILGTEQNVINPAPAVARQLMKVLKEASLLNDGTQKVTHIFVSSGDTDLIDKVARQYLGLLSPLVKKHIW